MADELVSRYRLLEQNERASKVLIVPSNGGSIHAMRKYMVHGAAVVPARFSCHALKVADLHARIDARLRRVCSGLRAPGVRAEHPGVRPGLLGSDPVRVSEGG